MQKYLTIKDNNCRSITALGYHPARREILTGGSDGSIKWWDLDSGRLSSSSSEHEGMITQFLYWTDVKLLLSASNDGTLVVWTVGATVLEKIMVSEFIDIINSSENGPNLERLMYLSEISYVVAIKTPILLFSGHSDGTFAKWEQIKSSEFLYSQESFSLHESIHKGEEMTNGSTSERIIDSPELKRRIMFAKKYKEESEKNMILIQGDNVAGYIRSVFIEELDILALSSENGSIQLWGFDDLLSSISHTVPSQMKTGSGTRKARLFFFTVSGGWDRRLCIWDVKAGKLQDTFCNPDLEKWHELKEVACDGAILDLAYAPKRNEIAYSSSDGMIYMRQFSPVGKEMKLVNVLQGHESDVTSIVWHSLIDKWISGSEDGTIRIWVRVMCLLICFVYT
ncbi:CIAO1 protein, partial [Polypterus senegalus]